MSREAAALALMLAGMARRLAQREPCIGDFRAGLITQLMAAAAHVGGIQAMSCPPDRPEHAVLDGTIGALIAAGVSGSELAIWFNDAVERHARPAPLRAGAGR
ncbi:MAG: hypothetical protein GC168_20530 [Candidatus Hydrogenedens sp.]|nr:hypothetical protein [Candidatus Hydrogenedens sp.]